MHAPCTSENFALLRKTSRNDFDCDSARRKATDFARMMLHETNEKSTSTASANFDTGLASRTSCRMLSDPRTGASASGACSASNSNPDVRNDTSTVRE